MHLPQRKHPPPIDTSRSQTILPPATFTATSAIHVLREPVVPHILWRYGQSIDALRYSVGRESSLPCTKSDVRQCLLTAIRLAHGGNARERLCAAYVQLEVFITDEEFEIVSELQDSLGAAAAPRRHGCSAPTLRRIAAGREGAGTPAYAILTRIAEQMLTRRRELRGDC